MQSAPATQKFKMFDPLLIVLAGLLDRVRGDGFTFLGRAVEKLIYGWILAALFGFPFSWLTILIAVGFAFGSSPGWGDTMGAILQKRDLDPKLVARNHFWQIGKLKTNKWAAAFARGFLWGLPVGLLGFFSPILFWAPFVYMLSYVGSLIFVSKFLKGYWGHAETVRGLMTGLLIYFVVNYKAIIALILSIL